MNSNELKELVFKRAKELALVYDMQFNINYGPAHFFKFKLCDGTELSLYFNLNENVDGDLIKQRVRRKIERIG